MWKRMRSTVQQIEVVNAMKNEVDRKNKMEMPTFQEFLQNTTFHGVKHIFDDDVTPFNVRRIIWLLTVLSALILFMVQVGQRINAYYEYQTNVDVRVIYRQALEFPAVTICNQNNFRMSKTYEVGLYNFIDDVFSSSNFNFSALNMSRYNIEQFEAEEFLHMASHQKETLFDKCYWQGSPCNLSDIQTIVTDMGICFTFNSGTHQEPLVVPEPGVLYGLSLIVNVEQYEYMRGPQNDAGIKILLHGHNEVPLMKDQGFAVAPGTHTFVGVQSYQVTSMSEPYGQCNPVSNFTYSQCVTDCRSQRITAACGCRELYMTNNTGAIESEVCNMTQTFSCVLENAAELQRAETTCNCTIPCYRTRYVPSMSYAHLSKFNVDRLVLDRPDRKAFLEGEFLKAREISQRVVHDILERDNLKMKTIMELTHFIGTVIQNNRYLTSFQDYAMYFSVADIITENKDNDDITTYPDVVYNDYTRNSYDMVWDVYYITGWYWNVNLWDLEDFLWNLASFLGWSTAHHSSSFLHDLEECIVTLSTSQSGDDGSGDVGNSPHNNYQYPNYQYPKYYYHYYDYYYYYYGYYYYNQYKYNNNAKHGGNDINCLERAIDNAKRDINRVFWTSPEEIQQEMDYLTTGYDNLVDKIFNTSEADPNSFPKHHTCLSHIDELKNTMPTVLTISSLLNEFMMASEAEEWVRITEEIIMQLNSTRLRDSWMYAWQVRSACDWMVYTFLDDYYDGLVWRVSDTFYDAWQYHEYMKSSFQSVQSTYAGLRQHFNSKVMPLLNNIPSYESKNITKVTLSKQFETSLAKKSVADMADFVVDFTAAIEKLYAPSTKLTELSLRKALFYMTNFSLPCVRRNNIRRLEWLQAVDHYNHSMTDAILANLTGGLAHTLDEVTRIQFEIFLTPIEGITEEFSDIATVMVGEIEKLQEDLTEYLKGSTMNVDFYMENFLQADIFYKELSYELVEQQPAFELLSLLSEVGGFLGLLLGASVITMLEILDYGVLFCMKTMKRKKQVEPFGKVVNVMPLPEPSVVDTHSGKMIMATHHLKKSEMLPNVVTDINY